MGLEYTDDDSESNNSIGEEVPANLEEAYQDISLEQHHGYPAKALEPSGECY